MLKLSGNEIKIDFDNRRPCIAAIGDAEAKNDDSFETTATTSNNDTDQQQQQQQQQQQHDLEKLLNER